MGLIQKGFSECVIEKDSWQVAEVFLRLCFLLSCQISECLQQQWMSESLWKLCKWVLRRNLFRETVGDWGLIIFKNVIHARRDEEIVVEGCLRGSGCIAEHICITQGLLREFRQKVACGAGDAFKLWSKLVLIVRKTCSKLFRYFLTLQKESHLLEEIL